MGVEDGVLLTIPGNIIDIEYSIRLIQDTSIDLTTAVLLDRVQKHLPISNEATKKLRKEHRSLPRHKVNEVVLEYLPKGQSKQNKIYKVGNLLSKLKRQGKIFLNDHKEWERRKSTS